MKVERIEELLRSQPPDEPTLRGELLLGPRIVTHARPEFSVRPPAANALSGAAVLAVLVGLIVVALVSRPLAATPSSRSSPSPSTSELPEASARGVIPWIEATPTPSPPPEPTPDPRSLPSCTSDDLVLTAGGWGGATGSLAGGASVVNISSNPCTVGGKPAGDLLDGRGTVIAHGAVPAQIATDAEIVVLAPGGVAGVITVWGNWCGDPPVPPLSVHLSLPGETGDLAAAIRPGPGSLTEVPRCDSPGSGSTFGVPEVFAVPEPSSGGYQPDACTADELAPLLGDWGAAAGTSYANLVIRNVDSLDCLLPVSPTFELRDAAGRRVVVARSEQAPASASTVLLPPGWAAIVRLGYANWCSPPPAMPLHADVVLGSARVAVELRSAIPVPPCMSAPQTPPPTLFYVGVLTIPGTPAAPEPDPGDTLPISVTVPALGSTVVGGTLDYTVTLTNVSPYDKPLNLTAFCPAYTERVFLPSKPKPIDVSLALNCEAAGVLAPNVGVAFAMRLPIPPGSPAGTATLVWQLGARGPAAKATFEIRSNG
jgi:hypothetical protein